MGRRQSEPVPGRTNRSPATTLEERENQVIAAAIDLAEDQILKGTASAAILVHYLKLGSSREKLEQAKLTNENHLLVTKKEMMESEKRVEELYKEALAAMASYSGQTPVDEGFIDGEFDE